MDMHEDLIGEILANVRPSHGIIDRRIFSDASLYQVEMERIFTRTWVFVAHESQFPNPHDFLTTYIGSDPVIVWRDKASTVHVFLNSCRHRGMRVCRIDHGNAKSFSCPYHGWTYSSDGCLAAVPLFKQAYHGNLPREQLGLFECPRVESYQGFYFACWDEKAQSLADYLGDVKWYFDIMAMRTLGGLEVIPGQQRYKVPGNWKLGAENFAGDNYHVPYTHRGALEVGAYSQAPGTVLRNEDFGDFSVAFENGHGLLDIPKPGTRWQGDKYIAEAIGKEAVEYLDELKDTLQRRASSLQADIFSIGVGTIFPNFSFNDFGSFVGGLMMVWHPRSATESEIWENMLFDRDAPKIIKDIARRNFTFGQTVGGSFGADDMENTEQITSATTGVISKRIPFDYSMGLGRDGKTDGAPEGMPGRVGDFYTDQNNRNFYAYWAQLMGTPRPHNQ